MGFVTTDWRSVPCLFNEYVYEYRSSLKPSPGSMCGVPTKTAGNIDVDVKS